MQSAQAEKLSATWTQTSSILLCSRIEENRIGFCAMTSLLIL